MVHVLYVTDTLLAGGIESQLVELVTRLDRARFMPHVLCLYGPRARDLHFAPRLRAAGIPLATADLGWSATEKAHGIALIVRQVWRLRPQVVQAEGYHANLLTRLARPLLPPTRLVGSVRGLESPKQLRYQRLSWRFCTRIVASGGHLAVMLTTRAHVPPTRVIVIPNSVDVERFATPHATGLRARIAPHARRVLLSVGRVSQQKRLHVIAEALGILHQAGRLPNDARVILLGAVEDATQQARLTAAIRENHVEGYITQYPPTSSPEDYYHAADATLLYTTLEGISVAMLESLAAGRPVIISEEANGAGVIAQGSTGWIVPTHDSGAFAEAIATVLTLPDDVLAAMAGPCRARAAQYAVARMVARYEALYDDLVRAR